MYFIDRGNIKQAITYMDALIALYEENGSWETLKDELALERLALGAIEAVIDVGNSMIDGFIMRDPGSYEDIIDILVDEKVITEEMDQPLKELVGLRKMLVREFIAVDHAEIKRVLRPGGTFIILETLGTGHETPFVNESLVDYFTYLENEGFQKSWIRTDFHFKSLAEASSAIGFFFGDEMAQKVIDNNWVILPECTGIWWKKW